MILVTREKIGSGATGDVYSAMCMNTGRMLALKEMHIRDVARHGARNYGTRLNDMQQQQQQQQEQGFRRDEEEATGEQAESGKAYGADSQTPHALAATAKRGSDNSPSDRHVDSNAES